VGCLFAGLVLFIMSGVSVSGFSFLRCCYTLLLTPYHRPLAPLRHITSVEVKLSRSSNRSLLPHLTADQYHEKGTTTRLHIPLINAYRLFIAITPLPYLNLLKATTMTRTYTHSIADNSASSQPIQTPSNLPFLTLPKPSPSAPLPQPACCPNPDAQLYPLAHPAGTHRGCRSSSAS
jgi:hypothetical protein